MTTAEAINPHHSIVDANIILRLIIKDVPAQTKQVAKLFERAAENSLILPDLVLLECVYVMEKLYEYNRATIVHSLRFVISHPAVHTQALTWNLALGLYQEAPISITDAYLCVLSRADRQQLISFDKRLKHYATVNDLA